MAHREKFLWAGCLIGLMLVLLGVSTSPSPPPPQIPADVAATVNGRPIAMADYERAVAQGAGGTLQGASNTQGEEEHARKILDTMIDHELLLGRALDLGLARSSQTVRQHLLTAMEEYVATGALQEPPVDDQLRHFFQENIQRFTGPRTYEVQSIFFRGNSPETKEKLQSAQNSLMEGSIFDEVATRYGSASTMALPRGALPPAALRMYLGPTAAAAVQSLSDGVRSEPIRVAGGWRIVRLVRSVAAPTPSFEKHRARVLDLHSLEKRREAMKRYLSELRGQAVIHRAPDLNKRRNSAPVAEPNGVPD